MDALLTLLLILLGLGVATAMVLAITFLLGARALNRRNRVSPDAPSPAPASWVGAPSAAPRMHRRLRTAVAAARAAATAPDANPQLVDVAQDLEAEAVALDAHVVAAGRMPAKARRPHLKTLDQHVKTIERLASQVSLESAQSQAPRAATGGRTALDQLAEQLDTMEEARLEVTRIEAEAGIDRVSPFAVTDPPDTPRPQPGA